MKHFTQLKTWLALCLTAVSLVAWGEETPVYTLSFSKLTSATDNYNNYSGSHDITCSNILWTVYGNQSQGNFLRVGGSNKKPTSRTLTSKNNIADAISKITIQHSGIGEGKNSEITINSITVQGSTSSSFTTVKSKTITSPNVRSAGTLVFSLDEGIWDANSYYKILVNYQVAATSGTNVNDCYIIINDVKFYGAEEEVSYTAHFSVNGVVNAADDCIGKTGSAITFPVAPTNIDGKKFVGWTTSKSYFNAETAPSDLCREAEMGENDIVYYAVFADIEEGSSYSNYTTNPLFTVTTADADFYSLYLDHAVTVPGNVTAYKGKLDGLTLKLEAIEGTIPANTGVLFKTEAAGEAKFVACADVAPLEDNDIKGVAVETEIAAIAQDKKVLVLGVVDGKVGFAQPAEGATTIAANKAYILVPASATAVRIFQNEETGIEQISQETTLEGKAYNLCGQRVSANAKGIVIVNGKKIFNK